MSMRDVGLEVLGCGSCWDFRSGFFSRSCFLGRSGLGRSFFDHRTVASARGLNHNAAAGGNIMAAIIAVACIATVACIAAVASIATMAAASSPMCKQSTVATTATKQSVASTATIAAAVAVASTIATAVAHSATTVAAAMAAVREQTTVATMTAKTATTATVASPTRLCVVLMAQHANAQNRKENGDSSDNRAIHFTFLQYKRLRPAAETDSLHPTSTAHKSEETKPIVISSRNRLAQCIDFNDYGS
jgi:hypothetical protein